MGDMCEKDPNTLPITRKRPPSIITPYPYPTASLYNTTTAPPTYICPPFLSAELYAQFYYGNSSSFVAEPNQSKVRKRVKKATKSSDELFSKKQYQQGQLEQVQHGQLEQLQQGQLEQFQQGQFPLGQPEQGQYQQRQTEQVQFQLGQPGQFQIGHPEQSQQGQSQLMSPPQLVTQSQQGSQPQLEQKLRPQLGSQSQEIQTPSSQALYQPQTPPPPQRQSRKVIDPCESFMHGPGRISSSRPASRSMKQVLSNNKGSPLYYIPDTRRDEWKRLEETMKDIVIKLCSADGKSPAERLTITHMELCRWPMLIAIRSLFEVEHCIRRTQVNEIVKFIGPGAASSVIQEALTAALDIYSEQFTQRAASLMNADGSFAIEEAIHDVIETLRNLLILMDEISWDWFYHVVRLGKTLSLPASYHKFTKDRLEPQVISFPTPRRGVVTALLQAVAGKLTQLAHL